MLHTIGGRYTYVRVPCETVSRALLGFELGEGLGRRRNHYDRLVHFC